MLHELSGKRSGETQEQNLVPELWFANKTWEQKVWCSIVYVFSCYLAVSNKTWEQKVWCSIVYVFSYYLAVSNKTWEQKVWCSIVYVFSYYLAVSNKTWEQKVWCSIVYVFSCYLAVSNKTWEQNVWCSFVFVFSYYVAASLYVKQDKAAVCSAKWSCCWLNYIQKSNVTRRNAEKKKLWFSCVDQVAAFCIPLLGSVLLILWISDF